MNQTTKKNNFYSLLDDTESKSVIMVNDNISYNHMISKEDYELLKLKPFAILIVEKGKYRVGDVLNIYTDNKSLKQGIFLKKVIKLIRKGIMEGINEAEIWDFDFAEETGQIKRQIM